MFFYNTVVLAAQCADKFGKFPGDIGSDHVIRDSAHEVPHSIGGFDGVLFGLDVIFHMARTFC